MNNKYGKVGAVTIAASADDNTLSLDFRNSNNIRVGVLVVCDNASLGCSLILAPGLGSANSLTDPIGPLAAPNPWLRFATPDAATTVSPPLAAPVLINDAADPLDGKYVSLTIINIVAATTSRFMNLQLHNDDPAETATVTMFTDS